MKAYTQEKYGTIETLHVIEKEKPQPQENEVLIQIKAVAINSTDPTFLSGKPWISRLFTGISKPKDGPGQDFAGIIEAVGSKVTQFQVGDKVYGPSDKNRNALTEYLALSEQSSIAKMPESISFVEAAGICDGVLTALPFLETHAKIQKGQKILINGISGSIGLVALQYAKYIGANVTGVCSGKNVKLVKQLGANKVYDYTKANYAKEGFSGDAHTYDIIFDTVSKLKFSTCKAALTPNGLFLATFPFPSLMIQSMFSSKTKGRRPLFVASGLRKSAQKKEHLTLAAQLIDQGYIRPIIDKVYCFADAPMGFEYVATGHKVGNVVVDLTK